MSSRSRQQEVMTATRVTGQLSPRALNRHARALRPAATETRSGRTGQRNENGYLAGADAPRARDRRDAMDADHNHEHERGHRAVIRRRQRLLLPAAHREQPLAGAARRPIRSGGRGPHSPRCAGRVVGRRRAAAPRRMRREGPVPGLSAATDVRHRAPDEKHHDRRVLARQGRQRRILRRWSSRPGFGLVACAAAPSTPHPRGQLNGMGGQHRTRGRQALFPPAGASCPDMARRPMMERRVNRGGGARAPPRPTGGRFGPTVGQLNGGAGRRRHIVVNV